MVSGLTPAVFSYFFTNADRVHSALFLAISSLMLHTVSYTNIAIMHMLVHIFAVGIPPSIPVSNSLDMIFFSFATLVSVKFVTALLRKLSKSKARSNIRRLLLWELVAKFLVALIGAVKAESERAWTMRLSGHGVVVDLLASLGLGSTWVYGFVTGLHGVISILFWAVLVFEGFVFGKGLLEGRGSKEEDSKR